jgi:hypothetical protein
VFFKEGRREREGEQKRKEEEAGERCQLPPL